MKIRGPAFPIAVAVFTVVVVIAGGVSLGHGHRILFVPAGAAVAMVLLTLGSILRPAPSADSVTPTFHWREAGWLLSILPAVLVLGVVAGSSIYLFAYLMKHGTGLIRSVSAATLAGMVVHLVFNGMLGARLYAGLPGWP